MVHTLISNNNILKVFEKSLLIRMVEETISKKYFEQKMRCPVHLSIGQEIAPSILSLFIDKNDKCISTHRCHAHYLSKGGNLNKTIAEIYGKKTGCSKGYGGSMHLIDLKQGFMGTSAIVGSSIPLSVGIGLNIKLKKSQNISIAYFGEGAREEGAFIESINLAIVKKLPVLFFCENNYYSVYTPLNARQPKQVSYNKVLSNLGIKTFYSKGKNINDMYIKIKDAYNYVKKNRLPSYIEIDCYRNVEHCGPNNDDHLGYRDKQDYKKWFNIDLLKELERYICKNKKTNLKKIKSIKEKNQNKIDIAFNFAENSIKPSYSDAYLNLYK